MVATVLHSAKPSEVGTTWKSLIFPWFRTNHQLQLKSIETIPITEKYIQSRFNEVIARSSEVSQNNLSGFLNTTVHAIPLSSSIAVSNARPGTCTS